MSLAFPRRPTSLDDLPNEILFEIISYFPRQREIHRRLRIAHVLSLVNRRLRSFAEPITLQHIYFPEFYKYYSWISEVRCGRYKDKLHFIHSIRVGDAEQYVRYCSLGGVFGYATNLLPNLRSFQWLGGSITNRITDEIYGFKKLNVLELLWRDNNGFPLINSLPELHTLRLSMYDSKGHEEYDPCGIHLLPSLDDKVSYPFLTTLAINFRRTSNWPTYAWRKLKFPKLKVIDLQNIGSCDPKIIYDFIQRHSTLLEVNVSFEEAELRFEGLIKLINGTGTWIARKKSIAVGGKKYRYTSTDSIAALDEPCLVYRQVPGKLKMKFRPLPDDLPNSYIIFDAFAFSRVPTSPTSTQWKSHKGSQNPRYEATKLALHIHDQYRWEKKFYKVAYIHDFLLYHEFFPKLEELRLFSETWLESDKYFDLYMREIGFRLANWKHLRKLSLSFVIPDNEWMWSYRDPELDLDPPAGYSSNHVRFIDDIVPPIEYWQGEPQSVNELRPDHSSELVEFIKRRLKTLYPEDYDTMDWDDRNLLMRVWGDMNESIVARCVKILAVLCPTLEEFDWYPMGTDSIMTMLGSSTRWRWKIHRGCGPCCSCGRGVRFVSGQLSWTESTQGSPDPMHIKVGQELEYAMTRSKRQY